MNAKTFSQNKLQDRHYHTVMGSPVIRLFTGSEKKENVKKTECKSTVLLGCPIGIDLLSFYPLAKLPDVLSWQVMHVELLRQACRKYASM